MLLQLSVDSSVKSEQLSVGPSIFQKFAKSRGDISTPVKKKQVSSVAFIDWLTDWCVKVAQSVPWL